jgi:hypothetical protein
MELKAMNPNKPEYPYSSDKFDKAYYGNKARGGFGEEIFWENPTQQYELEKKFNIISGYGDFETILFIGCAFGNEVRYFRDKGKEASGVEVSEYATSIVDKTIKDYVKLYNGWQLKDYLDKSIDVVASFDVLTLIPDDMLHKLVKEMCRVVKDKIVVRTVVDANNNQDNKWIGNDGVSFRELTINQWVILFSNEGFHCNKESPIDEKNEIMFLFERL